MADQFTRVGVSIQPQSFRVPNVTGGAGAGLASVASAFFKIGADQDRKRAAADLERGKREGAAAVSSMALNDGTIVPLRVANDQGSIEYRRGFAAAQDRAYLIRTETAFRTSASEIASKHRNDPAGMMTAMQGFAEGLAGTVPPEFQADYESMAQRIIAPSVSQAATRARAAQEKENAAALRVLDDTHLRSIMDNGEKIAEGGEAAKLAAVDIMKIASGKVKKLMGRVHLDELTRSEAAEEFQVFRSNAVQHFIQGEFQGSKNKAAYLKEFMSGNMRRGFPMLDPNNPEVLRFAEINPARVMSEKDRNAATAFMKARVSAGSASANLALSEVIGIINNGDQVAPALLNLARSQAPEATPAMQKKFSDALRISAVVEEMETRSIPDVQAAINQIEVAGNTSGLTGVQSGLKKSLISLHSKMEKEIKEDAISYGVKTGEFKRLSLNTPEEQFGRVQQAILMGDKHRMPVVPFEKSEIESLTTQFNNGDTNDQLNVIDLIEGMGMPSKMKDETYKRFGKQNALIGVVASVKARDPALARKIMQGRNFLKNNATFSPSSSDKTNADTAFISTIGNTLRGVDVNGTARAGWQDAADALYAHRMNEEGGNFKFDKSEYQKAIKDVAGPSHSRNGQSFFLPTNMEPDDFDRYVDDLLDRDLYRPDLPEAGPHFLNHEAKLTPVGAERIRDKGKFVSAGSPGKYFIGFEQKGLLKYAVDGAGKTYVFDVNEIAPSRTVDPQAGLSGPRPTGAPATAPATPPTLSNRPTPPVPEEIQINPRPGLGGRGRGR